MEWVFIISMKNKARLGTVRCLTDWVAAEDETTIWLKGGNSGEPVDLKIRQLPIDQIFLLDEKMQLFPVKGKTPVGLLQSMDWKVLTDFISVELPVAALPAQQMDTYEPRLVPAEKEQPCEVLLTDWATWSAYAMKAPAIRLSPLQFAASASDDVLVLGTPLPPIPGKTYWRDQQLFIPAGWAFEVGINAQILSRSLCPEKETFLLFDEKGQWERIPGSAFVKASRSAVRLCNEE